jgi:hypothetical protein
LGRIFFEQRSDALSNRGLLAVARCTAADQHSLMRYDYSCPL